jgi:hypothetical protein
LGKFEILQGNNITGIGYKNLGNLGNIKLTSTFGNIGLFTKEDKGWADLDQDTVCVAWNPSYLNQMATISNLFPSLS